MVHVPGGNILGGGQWKPSDHKEYNNVYEAFYGLCSHEEAQQIHDIEAQYNEMELDFREVLMILWNETLQNSDDVLPIPELKKGWKQIKRKNDRALIEKCTRFKGIVREALQEKVQNKRREAVLKIVTDSGEWDRLSDDVVKILHLEDFVKHEWHRQILRNHLDQYEPESRIKLAL